MPRTRESRRRFGEVLREFGRGQLRSSSGDRVTNPAQARAIAFSEANEVLRRQGRAPIRQRRQSNNPRRRR